MTHDYLPGGDDSLDTDLNENPDTLARLDPDAVEAILSEVVDTHARYLDEVAALVENAIENDPQPVHQDFEDDHTYTVESAAWDARMMAALDEAAQLRGKIMALGELLDELLSIKKYVGENQKQNPDN